MAKWVVGVFFPLFCKGKSIFCFSLRPELKEKLTALHRTGKTLLAACPKVLGFKLALLGSFVLCFFAVPFALESLGTPGLAPCATHAPAPDAAEVGSKVGLLGHWGGCREAVTEQLGKKK